MIGAIQLYLNPITVHTSHKSIEYCHQGCHILLVYMCLFRILQLYAEENAIEDTIYYLGEALRKDVIELEVFLKVWDICSYLQYFLKNGVEGYISSVGWLDTK